MFWFHIWKCQLCRPSHPLPEETGGAHGLFAFLLRSLFYLLWSGGPAVGQRASAGSSPPPHHILCGLPVPQPLRPLLPAQPSPGPSPSGVCAEPCDWLSPGACFVVTGEKDSLRCKEIENVSPAQTCCFLQSASQTRIPGERGGRNLSMQRAQQSL